MGISNVSGEWGDNDRPWSQSGQDSSSVTTGGAQTDAMPDVGPKENPMHLDYPQSEAHSDNSQIDLPSGQWNNPEPALPAEPVMMYAILTIPQDEYIAWVSSLPDFVKVMETKILDQGARDRLGL